MGRNPGDGTGVTRRSASFLDAIAREELGTRGVLPFGTRRIARGGTRARTTDTVGAYLWYARCAVGAHVETETLPIPNADADAPERIGYVTKAHDVSYHYAKTWARMPSDTLRAPHRVRVRLANVIGVALPQSLRDPDAPAIGVNDDGTLRYRAARGAIVSQDRGARRLFGATDHHIAGVRHAARVRRRQVIIAAASFDGAGL